MTTVTTVVKVELDIDWVDAILTTAFDYAEGSSNYWLVDEDVERIGDFRGINPYRSHDQWYAIELKGSEANVVIGGSMLSSAVSKLFNDPVWHDTHALNELQDALGKLDELPDLDGETCDVIVQVALFGELVYG